jgi:hypothetical protein
LNLPAGVSQSDFLDALTQVSKVLGQVFSFGPCDPDDVGQLVAVWSLEALPEFDLTAGTLGAYLFTHCHNRAANKLRDESGRFHDVPCRSCDAGNPCGPDGEACEVFFRWQKRNPAKASLSRPLNIGANLRRGRVPHTNPTHRRDRRRGRGDSGTHRRRVASGVEGGLLEDEGRRCRLEGPAARRRGRRAGDSGGGWPDGRGHRVFVNGHIAVSRLT